MLVGETRNFLNRVRSQGLSVLPVSHKEGRGHPKQEEVRKKCDREHLVSTLLTVRRNTRRSGLSAPSREQYGGTPSYRRLGGLLCPKECRLPAPVDRASRTKIQDQERCPLAPVVDIHVPDQRSTGLRVPRSPLQAVETPPGVSSVPAPQTGSDAGHEGATVNQRLHFSSSSPNETWQMLVTSRTIN